MNQESCERQYCLKHHHYALLFNIIYYISASEVRVHRVFCRPDYKFIDEIKEKRSRSLSTMYENHYFTRSHSIATDQLAQQQKSTVIIKVQKQYIPHICYKYRNTPEVTVITRVHRVKYSRVHHDRRFLCGVFSLSLFLATRLSFTFSLQVSPATEIRRGLIERSAAVARCCRTGENQVIGSPAVSAAQRLAIDSVRACPI